MLRATVITVLLAVFTTTVFARAESTNYYIPSDVQPAGGGERALSDNYVLSDTIGEANVGPSGTPNYRLDAGYRQTLETSISLSCGDSADLGTLVGDGTAETTVTCTVIADADGGYALNWQSQSETSNLVGWWKLDESSVGTAVDSSGYGNDGTHTSTPTISTDVFSPYHSVRSLNFDGSTEYVQIADDPSLNSIETVTIALWIKPDALPSEGNKYFFNRIIQSGNNNQIALGFAAGGSPNLQVWMRDGGNCDLTGNALQADVWQHVAVTLDGSTVRLYKNGKIDAERSCSLLLSPLTTDLFIATYNGANANWVFDGEIDDVRLYSTALAESDIRELASQSPPAALVLSGALATNIPGFFFPSTSGLVGHWKLEETSGGSTVLDWSGNNNDGTPAGAGGTNNKPQPSTSVPENTTFLTSRSLDFDGTDDSVSIGTPSVLDITGDLTLAAWVRVATWSDNKYVIADFDAGGSTSNGSLRIRNTSGNNFSWYQSGGSFAGESDTSLSAGVWYHVVITRDNTAKTITFHIDGEEDGEGSYSGNPSAQQGRYFGNSHPNFSDNFSGEIDDIRIYNRILSSAEIKALYSTTQTWSIPSSSAYWGVRLRSASTDTDAKWGTDDSSEKWINVGDGSYTAVERGSRTSTSGSTEVIDVRIQVGGDKIQEAGQYQGVMSIIAAAL